MALKDYQIDTPASQNHHSISNRQTSGCMSSPIGK
jgi:hypothetical protein